MNKKFFSISLLAVIGLISFTLGFRIEGEKDKNIRKATGNDDFSFIAANQVLMWCANNGDGSHDPRSGGNGFYWPGGKNATKAAIFEDGLLFGAKIGRDIRVNGNTHRQGLQAGKILTGGVADDPGKDKYRVYRVRKDWQSFSGAEKAELEKDFLEWPVEDGAPWEDIDGDGVYTVGIDGPEFIGDEVLWYVANDLDPIRSTFTYGTLPMGLEFQTTIFAFNRTGPLGDMVFKKYTIINKGTNILRDMYLSYWSDTDMGDAGDDGTGCDTVLSLGYTWNGSNTDGIYNDGAPPAVGYDFFQGPVVDGAATDSAKFLGKWIKGKRNLPMTAFAFYINGTDPRYRDPAQGNAQGSIEFYNYMQGLIWNGDQYIDPSTNLPTKFVLSGDPVAKTGWYAGPIGWPGGPGFGDVRHVMSSGPFNMAPGDTQEVVVGIVIARGANNLNSITELKTKDKLAQIAYDLDFNLTPAPRAPTTTVYEGENAITLWWQANSESYNEIDPLVTDTVRVNVNGTNLAIPVSDKTFTFEGYRVWQYKDLAGTDPVLIGSYDIKNGIKDIYSYIYDYTYVNGQNNPIVLIQGNDEGLMRFQTITTDKYTNGPLFNGNPYYFAVTAYAYSKYSDPPYLESPPAIVEVRPGKPSIDVAYSYVQGDIVSAERTAGAGDGTVEFTVVDPSSLTGNSYEVKFSGHAATNNLTFDLINKTTGTTLISNSADTSAGTKGKLIIDGAVLTVVNDGYNILTKLARKNMIKEVVQTKTSGGSSVTPPRNVLGLNTLDGWQVAATFGTNSDQRINMNWKEKIDTNDFEIVFGASDSMEYYVAKTTGINPHNANTPKGKGKLPFSVYQISPSGTRTRMYVRISEDVIQDSAWSQDPVSKAWESIMVYSSATPYAEPLPATSGTSTDNNQMLRFKFIGNKPASGTVVRINTYKPLKLGDAFTAVLKAPIKNSTALATENKDKISVFPNPYFGANSLERDKYQRFVTFTNMPQKATIRIFSLSGVFIQRIDKDDTEQYVRWNLRNGDGLPVASGLYIAYIDLPGVGTKIMKIAVIMETQFIDRL